MLFRSTFAEIISGARIILLTKGQITFVDAEDFDEVSKYKWCFDGGYARRNVSIGGGRQRCIYLHNALNRPSEGYRTDHHNVNKLDNRRHNLRVATVSQNAQNSSRHKDNRSGFKGVCWEERRRKWKAQIAVQNKDKFLGRFTTAELAHAAYCAAAEQLHGEYARTE